MKKLAPLPFPEVKKYTDVIEFLKDYFNHRKSLDPKFSYEVWAAELGFNSRSYLRMIIHKERKASLKFAEVFSIKANLNADQSHYLGLLTAYQLKTASASQKKVYLEKILEQQDIEHHVFEVKDYQQFLSSPRLAQIFLLLTYDDIEATPAYLKGVTGFSLAEIKKSLMLLSQLGMAQILESKIWKAKARSFKISGRAQDKSILNFHKNTLTEAELALKANPHFRHFRSIYFGVADEDIELLKSEVELFLTKMKKKFASRQIKNKRLVKLNLNAYPVSEKNS